MVPTDLALGGGPYNYSETLGPRRPHQVGKMKVLEFASENAVI